MTMNTFRSILVLLLSLTAATSQSCTWTETTTPPPAIWMSAAASSLGDAVAFCGGTFIEPDGKYGTTRNQVATYNPTTDHWVTFPNMTKRTAPAAGTFLDRLYVFGGSQHKPNASKHDPNPTINLALVESIGIHPDGSATETTWTQEIDLPFGPRESPSAVSVPGKGIVIGGGFDSGVVNGVFVFAYYNDSYLFNGTAYQRLPDMPFKRSNMAYVATNSSRVYALGGGATEPSYSTCAFLDLGAAAWSMCADLVDARSWAAAGVVGDEIVLAGGMDNEFAPTAEVDFLNVKNTSALWTNSNGKCDLPTKAAFISGGVTANGVFVVDAGYAPKNVAWLFAMH